MRIYELLNPTGPTPPGGETNGGIIQPSAVQPPPSAQASPPQQQAGFWGSIGSGISNFMSTPQPIGANSPKAPATPAPGTNAAGQPAFVDKAVNSTFIGDINRGLQQPQQPPPGPGPAPAR